MKSLLRGKEFVHSITNFVPPQGSVGIWHLNQAGFAFKFNGTIIYIDPYLSDDLETATHGNPDEHNRIYLPLLSGIDIDNADYVFCTHDHLDHLDPTTVKEISIVSPNAKFIVPRCATPTMNRLAIPESRVLYMDDESHVVLPEFEVRALKGAHETFDYDEQYGYPFLGYLITLGGINLYHSGDTVLFDDLVDRIKKFPIDLAFLPINGREYDKLRRNIRGNMNYKDAADYAVEINADIVFPCHWGMHYENTEDPGHFVDYVVKKYLYQRFRVMTPGDSMVYFKGHS